MTRLLALLLVNTALLPSVASAQSLAVQEATSDLWLSLWQNDLEAYHDLAVSGGTLHSCLRGADDRVGTACWQSATVELDDLASVRIFFSWETHYTTTAERPGWTIVFNCTPDAIFGPQCVRNAATSLRSEFSSRGVSMRVADLAREDMTHLIGALDRFWKLVAPGRPCTVVPKPPETSQLPCSSVGGA